MPRIFPEDSVKNGYETGALARLARSWWIGQLLTRTLAAIAAVGIVAGLLILANGADGKAKSTWTLKMPTPEGCRVMSEGPCEHCNYQLAVYVVGGEMISLAGPAVTTDTHMPDGGTMRQHAMGGPGNVDFQRPDGSVGSVPLGACDIVIERFDAEWNPVYLWVWICQ
jgi:hypothetical protein